MKLIIFLLCLLISTNLACQPNNIAYNVWDCYTVQAGDTIYSIAAQLGTSPILICDYNSNFLSANCTNIAVGESLIIPPTCVESEQWSCEVITEEYLQPIAVEYNIAYDWIYQYNTEYLPNPYGNYSSIGMKIRVPHTLFTRICIPGTTQYCYTAQPGDTIYSIGAAIGENAGIFVDWNWPWLEQFAVNPGWQLMVKRSCVPQQGVFFCYKIIFNDTFYSIGQTFGVPDNLLCQFNINQTGVINCTEIQTEGVEIMIPILDASGNLPTINNTSSNGPQLLRSVEELIGQFKHKKSQDEQCLDEKSEINRLLQKIKELEAALQQQNQTVYE